MDGSKIGKAEDLKQPYRSLVAGNRYYSLRDSIPARFQSERIPLGTDELVKRIVARINLDANVLNAGRRKSFKVNRMTINIFNQAGMVVEAIPAKLSNLEIIRRSQHALCDAVIDPKDLQSALLARLEKEYNEYQGMELSNIELAQSLNMILALYPTLIRNASKSCLAEFKEIYETAELPRQIEASESVIRASLNSYGIIPAGLNDTERKFAQLLETDTSNTINWWHRNEDRKPYSVSIVLPNGHRYFPDFIIGVNNRNRREGILLFEIKGGHILNSDDTLDKITAEHKVYGKPVMLTLDDGKFWIMEYIESSNRIEKEKVFRVENMGQY